jgi:hypothetical protein
MPDCPYCLDLQFVYTGECRVVNGMETLFELCKHCCRHHWIVGSPEAGVVLNGRCNRCYATREFQPTRYLEEWGAWAEPRRTEAA